MSQNDSQGNVRVENSRTLVNALRWVLPIAGCHPVMRKAAALRIVTTQWPPHLHLEASQRCAEWKPDEPLLHSIIFSKIYTYQNTEQTMLNHFCVLIAQLRERLRRHQLGS